MKMNTLIIKQNGAATLLITTVLMLLVTSAAIFSAKFSSQDVKISANDYRAKQAEAAAQAGVDHALNILNKQDIINGGIATGNIGSTNLTAKMGGLDKTVGSYLATYKILDLDTTATKLDNNNLVTVTSTGISADNSASRIIEMTARFSPVLISPPKGNIYARGTVKLGTTASNIKIDNNVSKIFVWSGGAITDNSGTNLNNTATIFTSTNTGSNKPELLPADTLLNTTLNDNDKFFRAFFGADNKVIKKLVTVVKGDDASFATKLSKGGRAYWLTGNVTLTGTYGGNTTNPGPVIIFVDSGATLVLNNATINGLLYVDRAWTHDNSILSTINGAVIVNGDVTVTNTAKLTINFNYTDILEKLPRYVGVYSHVAGSWQEK